MLKRGGRYWLAALLGAMLAEVGARLALPGVPTSVDVAWVVDLAPVWGAFIGVVLLCAYLVTFDNVGG